MGRSKGAPEILGNIGGVVKHGALLINGVPAGRIQTAPASRGL